MLHAWILFAQAEPEKKGDNLGLFSSFVPIIAIVAIFYLLIIVPGRKEKNQRQAMMGTLKRNDKVVTSGGIVGIVVNLKEGSDEVTIRSEDTKLLILRSSIARVLSEPEKEGGAQTKPAT